MWTRPVCVWINDMGKGTHQYVPDERNASILVDINGEHVPRAQAMVSVP